MKNIFKFMSMALVASMMLVACGDKDENKDDTTTTNPTPATPTATVTFKGQSWEAGAAQTNTNYAAQYGLVMERMLKVAGQVPYVDVFHTINPGNYSTEATTATAYEGTDSAYTYVSGSTSEDIYSVEYGEQTQVQTQNGYSGDWALLNATMNISAFDLNTLTATYTLNATMYDFYSWAHALVNDVEDAETAALKVDVKNYTFAQ